MSYSAIHAGKTTGAERRQFPRRNLIDTQLITIELSLGLQPLTGGPGEAGAGPRLLAVAKSGGPLQRAILINISEGGVALQPYLPLSPGDTSPLRFGLPGLKELIQTTGMVAWVGPGGRAGVRFVDLTPAVRADLRHWMGISLPAPLPSKPSDLVPSTNPSLPATEEIDLPATLELIAEHACRVTAAQGAAIAVRDDQGIVCRASHGNAPDVGVRLQSESGLTGYCVRTGELVHCADALQDSRINAEAVRGLGIRSLVIVPVYVGGTVAGLLEVLSAIPEAFTLDHLIRLRRLAGLLSKAIDES